MSRGYKTHSDPGPAPGPGWLGAASEGKEPLKVKQNTIRGLSRAEPGGERGVDVGRQNVGCTLGDLM